MTNKNTPGRALAAGSALAAAVAATPAFAHPGHGSGLVAGLTHPFSGADHLLAMLAVGLWAATREAGRAWHAPVAFIVALAMGGVIGVASGPAYFTEWMVSGSLIAFAMLLFVAPFVGDKAGLALIAVFALSHGQVHGAEAIGSIPAYFAGFLAASAALHFIGWRSGRALFASPAGRWLAGFGLGAAGLALTLS